MQQIRKRERVRRHSVSRDRGKQPGSQPGSQGGREGGREGGVGRTVIRARVHEGSQILANHIVIQTAPTDTDIQRHMDTGRHERGTSV